MKKVIRPAAREVKKDMQGRIHDSDGEHKRYSAGKVIATYQPGNLRRSIKVFATKTMKTKLLVGPKRAKGSAKGEYGGSRTDPYYAHMVNYGTKVNQNFRSKGYAEATFDAAKATIRPKLITGIAGIIDEYKKEVK